jgi:hemolysin III
MKAGHNFQIGQDPIFYTAKEELANSITHGVGAGLSVVGLILLVTLAAIYGDVWRVVSFTVYGISLLALYSVSTLYHSVRQPRWKRRLRVLDHASIYLLIAGSYTPFVLVHMRETTVGWTILGVVWSMALLGIAFKTLFTGRFEVAATAAYVVMGWLAIFGYREMMSAVPPGGVVLIFAGGITYTLGVVFYAWQKLPYNHAIWHLFVLGGSVFHFFAVLFYTLPAQS